MVPRTTSRPATTMTTMHLALAIFAVTLGAWAVLGQPSPSQGLQLNGGNGGGPFDTIWPLTATQCEPFLIYFDSTGSDFATVNVIFTPDGTALATFLFPARTNAYLDWICNIPAGQTFYASFPPTQIYYTVQSGPISACLGALSTTYSNLFFSTGVFQTYTSHPYSSPTSVPTVFVLFAYL